MSYKKLPPVPTCGVEQIQHIVQHPKRKSLRDSMVGVEGLCGVECGRELGRNPAGNRINVS